MKQPEGYADPKNPHRVCKLHKTLYGMKQAMREANNKLRAAFLKIGVSQISSDDNVYYYSDGTDVLLFGVFVDDIQFLGTNEEKMESFYQKHLQSIFEMTLEKEPTTYLKFEIEKDRQKVLQSTSRKFNT